MDLTRRRGLPPGVPSGGASAAGDPRGGTPAGPHRSDDAVVVRSRLGRMGTGLVAAAVVVAVVLQLRRGGLHGMLAGLLPMLLVLAAAVLMWWLPQVRLDERGLVLANPFSSTRIGWGAVESSSARLGFQVRAGGRTHHAWAAPARSSARAEDRREVLTGVRLAPGEHDVDAHTLHGVVEDRLEALRASGAPLDDALVRTVHWARIALLVLLAAGSAVALFA